MSYRELISTLPKEESVIHPSFDFYQYQGFWFPLIYLEATIKLQEQFEAHPTEMFLCSFPKTGTTWLKALTFAIMTRDHFDQRSCTNSLLTALPHECVPTMELHLAENRSYRIPQLPLLATHIPYTSLPNSIIESGCKIIYICREPKDTFTSLWHFLQKITRSMSGGEAEPRPLEKELELFCAGKSGFGPYWDHVLGFWKASMERPEAVLFLKYEELKRDASVHVKRMAEFMGRPFSAVEEKQGVPEGIAQLCSFQSLSNLEVNKNGADMSNGIKNNAFFRTGEVGDWKNLLTEDMKMQIDKITEQKLQSSDFKFD